MGKCVRIRGSSKPPPSLATEAAATAASCLTLRSGRRVLAASSACSPRTSGRSRRHRGSALRRWCGAAAEAATANKKRACGSPRRSGAADAAGSPTAGRVLGALRLCDGGDGRPEAKVPPSSRAADTGADGVASGVDHGRGDSFDGRPKTPPMSEESDAAAVKAKAKHENQSHRCRGVVTSQKPSPSPSPLPPTEAEIETFFAAAELAERRRFAEAYNYDVALDRPLEGRFQWSPVNT